MMSGGPGDLEWGTYIIRCAHAPSDKLTMFCFPPTHFTSGIVPPPLGLPIPVTTSDDMTKVPFVVPTR
jgi:hypothetical protein